MHFSGPTRSARIRSSAAFISPHHLLVKVHLMRQFLSPTGISPSVSSAVVLRDKDMVKTFVAQRQRPPIFGCIVTVLGSIIIGLLLLLAGVSLATNRQLLNDAAFRGEKVLAMRKADAGKDILAKNEDDTRREIVVTDELRSLMTQLDDYDRNGAPFYMRFGMY